MPKLYEITDAYTGGDLPVEEAVLPTDRPRVIINTAEFDKPKEPTLWDNVGMAGVENKDTALSNLKSKASSTASGIADAIKYASELDQKFTSSVLNFPKKAYENSDDLVKGLKNLFGLGEGERYQLWPEKVAREALTSAGDIAKPNPYPEGSEQYYEYEGKRQEGMVPAAMAISALAGSGGLGGTGAKAGEVALGATPFLRPALKHKEKLYKGKPGQEHQDIIPKELYEDFRQKAMSGEDLAEYNFGFINDKGHFLDREKALKYGIDTGLIDPHSGKFGALTTTLMADSSKPGTAIESVAKSIDPYTKLLMKQRELENVIPAVKDPTTGKVYTVGTDHADIAANSGSPYFKNIMEKIEKATADGNYELVDKLYDDFGKHQGFLQNKKFVDRNKFNENEGIATTEDLNTVKSKSKTAMFRADSSKEGAALQANKPAFYSAVEHTVKNIPQAKMTGEQWLGTIANKPGVKGEELDWIGLKDFLTENKGKPVTKQQIEEHIASNKVELKEVRKGGEAGTKEKAFELAKEHGWKSWDEIDAATQAKYMQRASREAGENPTKYHSYQLPGADNYKEMLLTLPSAKTDADFIKAYAKHTGMSPDNPILKDATPEQVSRLRKQTEGLIGYNYKSSHWDEPNILAHVRMNDRTIDGKKSLHLEEIQSDWHQQGRDRGYKQGVQEIKGFKPEELKLEKGEYDWSGISPDGRSAKVGQGVAKTEQEARDYLTRHLNKLAAEQNSAARIAESDKLPDAPFKKTWHELALKRMLREAAEKGYDRLSWTPGEAQAARYSLEKQLKELQYLKNDDGTYSIAGVTKDGGGFNHPENVTADKLPNIVGKEMAEKIIKNEGKRARGHPANGGYFEGVDLKIGGEGMKGFYDQIIPKALEKLGKEHGVKVQKGEVPKGQSYVDQFGKTKYEPAPVFYIDIPQSLKDTALNKGFPLFSSTPGYMFVPFEGDPFKDLK